MSRTAQRFRQSDLAKAIKAAVQAGLTVGRVEISPDGKIAVIAGKPGQEEQNPTQTELGEWD
jgi:hypothetical protein